MVGIFEYPLGKRFVGQDLAALCVHVHGTHDADYPARRGGQQHRHTPHRALGDHQRGRVAAGKIGDEWVRRLNLLADYAAFCGTGHKTAHGMGQTQRR
jgi:hypothetical protein